MNLKVDKEFQEKIPPLTEAEFEQLKENILSDGEVYEPIAVWNGVIVDGHNRWKIILEHPEIPYRVKEMNFPDKWAAFDWMYKKQLGRRNLTDEQRTMILGKMYEARKNTSAFKGNQHTQEVGGAQNGHNQRTAEAIAQELGVGKMIDVTKGYKAFEPGLICRGKHYAENTTFEEEGGKLCGAGMMHYVPACVKAAQVDGKKLKPDTYYKIQDGEFTEVNNG